MTPQATQLIHYIRQKSSIWERHMDLFWSKEFRRAYYRNHGERN